MNLKEQIKDDYGTLKRFARLQNINLQSLYMTLCGYHKKNVVKVLIERGYIQNADELRKVA